MLIDVLLDLGILYVGLLLKLCLARARLAYDDLLSLLARIVLTHARFGCRNRRISSVSRTMLLKLLIILIAQATDLINLNTTLHQLGYNLCLTGASLGLRGNKLHYLLVAHALSEASRTQDKRT